MAEFASRLVAFGRVAVMASQRQVADAIGTAPRAGSDVIDLGRHLRLATVRTAIVVFVQQVGPYLPPGKLPVLVLDARDLRVLKQLGVEADLLDVDADDGEPSAIAPGPGEDVAHTGTQRGRQPPFGNGPVVEARRAVTQIGTASAPPGAALGLLAVMDGLPAMLHFGAKERMMHLSLWRRFCPHQSHAAGSAARINFEHALLQHTVLDAPVAQTDDKGLDRTSGVPSSPCLRDQELRLDNDGPAATDRKPRASVLGSLTVLSCSLLYLSYTRGGC